MPLQHHIKHDYHPDNPDGGSGHGSDVPFAFQTLAGGRQGSPTPEALELSDMISSYWVDFAKTGDPNGQGLPQWPAFSRDDPKVMVFDQNPSARPLPNIDKLKIFAGYNASIREGAK